MTRGVDFQALFQQGKRVDRPSLIVLWRDTDGATRVGFTVSRQLRGAVKRNRVRRRLREAYRRARGDAPTRVALVVIGRARALETEFHHLLTELRDALGRIPGPRPSA